MVLFEGDGRSPNIAVLDAANDAEALMLARRLAEGRAFEIWDALTMLGRYDPTG